MANKKKILITGVAGFIGSRVASRFISEGFDVFGIDDLSRGKLQNIPKGLDFKKANLFDERIYRKIPKRFDAILHLAGQSSGEESFYNPQEDLKKNTLSTLNLIKHGINSRAEKIVYASSMSVYGDIGNKAAHEKMICSPISCYGISKLASEKYLNVFKKKLPFISLRMFNVFGYGQDMENLRQGMVSIYIAQALKNNIINVRGSISRLRDFIYIDDVVEAWFRSTTNKIKPNQILNLGSGKTTSVKRLLQIICKEIKGCKYNVKIGTPGDQKFIFSNNSEIKKQLKLKKFIELSKAIKLFISELRKNSLV